MCVFHRTDLLASAYPFFCSNIKFVRLNLLNPVHVTNKKGFLWKIVHRIRLEIINSVVVSHRCRVIERFESLLFTIVAFKFNFLAFVVVFVIIRMRFILQHVIVHVMDMVSWQSMSLKRFVDRSKFRTKLTFWRISIRQMFQFGCRDFMEFLKVCSRILKPNLLKLQIVIDRRNNKNSKK